MKRSTKFWLVNGVVVLVAGSIACSADYHSAAGGSCQTSGAVSCDSASSAQYCNGANYEEISCRGPSGCAGTPTLGYTCDDDLANVGDGCVVSTNASYSCGTDHASKLVCDGGSFALALECRGPGGCTIQNNVIYCDNTIAAVGDPCTTDTYACSVDSATLLHCVSSTFVADNTCRGPNQCAIKVETTDGGTTRMAECDDSKALPGDVCDEPTEETCSVDGTEELTCSSGDTFVIVKSCPASCVRQSGGSVSCD